MDKAKKFSPLQLSLVKPPDPEKLAGLSMSEQREMMAHYAASTLSQLSTGGSNSSLNQAGEEQMKGREMYSLVRLLLTNLRRVTHYCVFEN